ncbi:MAG TPA: LacI family DNA-binding transcriptional regulator [Longimicrobiales bacterium]
MKVTIRDVAREAGVSLATVLRVFNASGPVREPTRQQILELADRLRSVPDSTARSPIMRRTGTLGVRLPDLHGEFFSEVIRGIDGPARARGDCAALQAGGAEVRDEWVVPDDVSVAGFDDIPIAADVSPPRSSVQVAIAELASRAVGRLVEAIAKKNQHVRRQEVLPARLVIRASCGASCSR